MNYSVFAYPGNKASLSDWIIEHLPDHRLYVEVFGGAAGVLANKPSSHNEVYNDVDEDLVQFFDMLRDRHKELVEWLRRVPYSREKYDEWVKPWYHEDWRPDDPVERAGVFFYHRCVSFGGTYQYEPGFGTSTTRNQARTFSGQIERLDEFAARFQEVVIENLNWRELIEKYDDPEGVFYLDPPYYNTRDRYRHGRDFDHEELAEVLQDIDAQWIASYGELPPSVQEQAETVVERNVKYHMGAGYNGGAAPSTETLAMSYEPASTPTFIDHQQQRLVSVADGGETPAGSDSESERNGGDGR